MFGKFKEKLKNWTKKISEKPEEIEEVIENEETEIKEIEVPEKFNPSTQKFEPDTEKLEEIEKELPKKKETEETSLEKEEKKPSFFKKISSKISKVKISEEEFDIYAEELELLLLENNVAYEVAEKMIKDLKEKIVGQEFLKKEIEGQIKEAFKDIIQEILIEPFDIIEKIKSKSEKPYVILFCGINGTGKTTSIAKISEMLKNKKISSVLAAGDTFRAASIEQLKKHGEKLKVPVIAHEYNTDPAAVGFDAIEYAKKNKIDCVLIDTAGRMHTAKNLMAQIEKVVRVCNPDLKIYVGESTTGNDAIEQIRSFNFSVKIDGIILSKADIDEKGGTALSVGYVTKRPILFLGTGQEYDAIEPFDKQKFIMHLGLDED